MNVDFTSYSENNDVVGIAIYGADNKQENITVNINGGTFKVGGKNAFAQVVQVGMSNGYSKNCTVNVSGGEVILNPTENGTGYVYTTYKTSYATAEISGGKVSGNVTALVNPYMTVAEIENDGLTISGGTFTTTSGTTLNVEKYLAEDATYDAETGTVKTNYVATVNGVGYASLDDAIKAAKDGDTIYVSAGEYTTYDNASPKKSLTFVGAGAGNTIWTIGNLNNSASGEGNGDYSFDGCDTITFKDMTLKSDSKDYRGFIRINNTVVENCTLEGKTAYWGYNTATFTGCTFNAPEGDYALWDYSTKTMTFDGCEFNISGKGVNVYVEAGNAGSEARKVEAKDCTINSTKANKAFLNIKNKTQAYEVTLSGDNKVNGLDTNSTTGSNLYQVEATTITETDGKTVKVQEKASDGTLTTVYEVKAASTAVATVGGVEYATLAEAITAATRNSTVKLLADTRENVTIDKALTLDLNGFTLNGGTEKAKPALTITARTVTIKDSSEAQTGTIMREDTAENSGVSSHYVIDIQGNAWVMFESGKVTNNSGNTEGKGASLVRVGDDSVAKFPGLNIKGGTFTQDNFIVIKVDRGDLFLNGGTLNSANSYAVENWLRATIKGGTVNGAVSSWTYSSGSNSTLTISGGTINGNVESVSYDGSVDKKAKVSITGGTVNGTLSTKIYDSMTTPDKEMATIEVTGGMFTEDPTKYVIEDSAITKNADGTFGVAKAYLAKVGDTSYYTMDEAFKAQTASGEPIVLLRDYTTGSTFNSGTVARVVDLNGHTWTCTGTDANSAAFEINNPNASLTVKNGKIVSSQLVGLIPSAMGGTIKYDNSSLMFENVQMSTTATSGIETNGNNTNDTVKLVNSTLNVPNGFGIYFPSSGKLIIENSKITAKTMGVQVCSGALSITGADTEITVTGDAVPKTENDGAIQDGAAISIVNRTGYKGLDTVTVSGGKFTAKKGNSAIKAYNWENKTESDFTADKGTVAVSGGTFSSEVSEDLCADGFIPTKNADDTYGVKAMPVAKIGTVEYATLDAAIAAVRDGDVIVVSAGEYKLNGSLTYTGKAFTIKAADGAKVSFDMSNAVALHGAKITFEGVTFDYKTNGNYIGLQHADTLVYNSCTINGMVFLYATNETFNGCTFNQTSAGAYNVWTYGAKNVKFNGCVFNCVGKSVLLYNEGANTGTDLTVTDTTFNASAPVAGKAAIEIDTSLMSGGSKVTVDKATADKTTGFAKGSNSGNSLWNDKKQTAETNKNTTVIVNGETVFEPAIIDLDTFIKKLVASGYNFDGKLKNGGKLTVKWSPVSGCYDTRAEHTCTVNGVKATGNTPKRVNSGLTQFQLFEGSDVAVIIKNVKFVYEPADFTVCENSGWKGSFTAEQAPAGQLYFMTTGDVTVDSCDFEKVVFTTFNTTGTSIVKDCTFKDVYNNYAIKDIRGENVSVTGTTIENCGGGIMVSSTGKVSNVTITGNTFKDVDIANTADKEKVGTRAILQIASLGKYENTAFDFSGNSATSCGPVIRQLNKSVAPVGSSLKYLTEGTNSASGLYTSDSEVSGYIKDENGNVTISTAEGLFWFAKQVNSGNNFAGKTVKLANDIDLNNELWTPIGIYDDSKTHFKGTFDGQNHIVSGLNVVESRKNGVGFFGKVYTGTIKNLTVEGNITAYGCNYVGGIIGHGYATITNCTFRGNVGSNTTMQVGGIAGSGGFTVTNCSVYGKVIAECWAGGIVGNCQDGGAYTNCYIEGEISAERTYWGGGAAGITPVPLYPSQVISGCYSNTVVKVAGEEVNCPIIASYNNPLDYNGYTGDLKIYDNSWNKQKNSNDSYPIYAEKNGVGGVLAEGKTVSRDNNLIMLEDDLKYVEGDLSAVRIMAGSAVTQEQVDALAMAQIGDRKYTSLDTAIAAAKDGDTVTLLADVTADVVINKNITLDLGGKTLTNTGAGKATLTVAKGATATVKNGSIVGGASYYTIQNNGTATFEELTATAGNTGSSMLDNWGTLTITSGTYTGGLDTVKSEEDSKLTITGGKFVSDYAPKYNVTGTILVYGETAITGGEFVQNSTSTAARVVVTGVVEGHTPSLTKVSGGKFTTKSSGAIFHWMGKATPDNFEVSGGSYSKSVSELVCADGFIPTKNADGTYGVKEGMYVAQVGSKKYETLADAIRLAAKGKTIKLLADVTEDVVITANKSITLDLNGKTLNGGTGNTKATITNYGTITITDSSAEKTGTIKRDDNGTEGETSYYVIRNFGTMTIEQANIINNSGYKKTNPSGSMVGSSLICNGDDDAYSAVLNIKGGTIRQDNFIAIKNGSSATLNVTGGKITSKHSAVQNWCNANITGGELNGQLWTDSWDSNSTGNTVMGGDAKFTGEIVIDITGSIVPKFEITGGTLDVTNWRITTEAANAGAKPAVSGGTFTSAVPEEYCAEGFIPTKNADGTYGVKAGKYVAKIGDVKYETLIEAFAAAKNGDTITLLEDCKSDRINLEDKSVTVVLNGKTLTSTAAYGVMFCAKNGNKITIDGTVEGSKLVGTLMITSGTDGHIEVNGGTYESNQYCPIYVNGSVSSENSTVTVKNAIIQAINSNSDQDSGCAVYLAGYSTSVFENCTITAPITGIEIRAGKLTLNNCNVTGGNGEVTADANGNGTTVTNAALAISQHNTKKPIDVTIDGGTFNGTAAVYQTDVQGTGSADVKIAVKSGTFNGTISGETDGTIAISGGKFKFKVDDKYFANGHVCSGNPGADGYYTIADHPIISAGLTISADMSFRVKVRSGYKNGSLRYYYDTIGENNTIVRVEGEGILGATDAEGNSIFRIYNVNPQRADLVYTFQYYDAEGNAVGTPKQRSVIAYFEDFYNLPLGDNEDLDAKKTFIANFLEYCASAMERSYDLHKDVTLNGKTWQDRADAVREMMTRLGLAAADYEFKGNLGRYYKDNSEGIILKRGVVFGSTFKAYYQISKEAIDDNGYRVFRQGMDVTDKLELVDGAYRLYFELAPYEFKDNLTITVNNGTTKVCEYTSPLANTLEVLSKSTDASLAKMAKAAFNYFVALQNYNG